MPNNYLFIHQNMPAQFLHLCKYLRSRGHSVYFITKNKTNMLNGITKVMYKTARDPSKDVHPYLRNFEDAVLHGQAVFRSIDNLLKRGFRPDIVIGHAGWGETMFVRDALPDVPILNYFEFYYNSVGQDVGFDPEFPANLDSQIALRVRNSVALVAHAGSDRGLTPTLWQFRTHPAALRADMSVIHEGIDTDVIRPNPEATFTLPNGKVLRPGMKVITFVARNLEPYRGFHIFMRALPDIQKRHPDAEVVIVGQDGVSYGRPLPDGQTYKQHLLDEVSIDRSRVHFTGHLRSPEFRSVMHVSAAHIYLTYPFVLSWSLLEAMATGCLVIASRTQPLEEVIEDGHNGLLVDFFDRATLVDRVDEALSNPAKFKEMRTAARHTAVARYDTDTICLPKQLGLVADLMKKR